MTILTKLRTPVLTVGLRNLHRTSWLLSSEEMDEKKLLLEEAPWKNFSPRIWGQCVPNPVPILNETYDEPHGLKCVPIFWILLLGAILPLSIYGWYEEYQHIFVTRHRLPFPRHSFLHAPGAKSTFPFGDGKHTPMHHPYFNFTRQGYETDRDGNPLPPGEYAYE